MLKEILFNSTAKILLGKMLDKAALNQRVISSNVANVNTPNYQKRGVSFDEKLRNAMRPGLNKMLTTNPRHFPDPDLLRNIKPEVVLIDNGYWNGINNVNIDEEMVELGKNQLDFDIAVKLLNNFFTNLRTAIRGRR